MQFSPQRKRQLILQLRFIYVDLLEREYLTKKYNPLQAREKFLTWVYEANLTEDKEELFLLGSLAECVFRAISLATDETSEWIGAI
jgi:hypothetical protein